MADQPILKEYIVGIQNSLRCSICLELLRKPVATKCLHQFCEFCILKCVKKKGNIPCPLCKEPVSKRALKPRDRLNSVTNAIRDLVTAYEEDTGYAFSAPSGPSRIKDITSTPEVSSTWSSRASERLTERVAMASLENTTENTEPVLSLSDNNDSALVHEETKKKKITRKVVDKELDKNRKKEDLTEKSNDIVGSTTGDNNSVFSAEQESEEPLPAASISKESPPDIFKETTLCPIGKDRKKSSREKSRDIKIKVQNWLSRLPATLGDDEEESSPGKEEDSQGSDQTVLLDSDAELEISLEFSSQNATIAPDSSRSLSLSSNATSPNHNKKFFKHRNDQRIEAMKVAIVSPGTSGKTEDPYAYPCSGTKAKPKRATTRKAKSSTNLMESKSLGFDVSKNTASKKSPAGSDSSKGSKLKRSPLSLGSGMASSETSPLSLDGEPSEKRSKIGDENSVEEKKIGIMDIDNDDADFQVKKSKLVAETFGPDSAEGMKAKVTKTYARNRKSRLRRRGAKKRIESESDSSGTDDLGPLPVLKEEISECSTLVAEENVNNGEPEAKRLKRSNSHNQKCEKIQSELNSMEEFELDVMSASQQVRDVSSKREAIAAKAKREVRQILNHESNRKKEKNEIEEEKDESAEHETDGNNSPSQAASELILEVNVKDSQAKLERFETVKRIIVSPPNMKSTEKRKSIEEQEEEMERIEEQKMKEVRVQIEENRTSIMHDFSEPPETLIAVSMLVGDSEMTEDSEAPQAQNRGNEESENVVKEAWDDQNVQLSASPVLERSISRKSPILSGVSEQLERSASPIIVNSGHSVRTTQGPAKSTQLSTKGGKSTQHSAKSTQHSTQGSKSTQKSITDTVEKMDVHEVMVESVVLNCRASDSSDDDLPDLGSQLKMKVESKPEPEVPKTKSEEKLKSVTSSGTNDKTDSLSLSVSQVRFEKPPGTSESHSSISSVQAPAEPLNSEHLTSSGRASASKSNSSAKSKATPISECSKLSESETNLTSVSSEIPSTQMRDNLQNELHDLSRIIREKEAQLQMMNTLRTQAESTIAPESDSDSDLFESQDATVYDNADGAQEFMTAKESSSAETSPVPAKEIVRQESKETPSKSLKEASQSILNEAADQLESPEKFTLTASPAPPTPPSFQNPNQSAENSIIAPTPRKSPKSLAADIARTFPSIKSANLPSATKLEEEVELMETPVQKKEYRRIQTAPVDSDSETEMVPNSVEDITPRRGTLDVFLTKKRLSADVHFSENAVGSQMSEASESLVKTPKTNKNRLSNRNNKGSELMKNLIRDKIVDSEVNTPIVRSPVVVTGGNPVLPSRSKTRATTNSELPSSPIGKTSVEADPIQECSRFPTMADILNPEELSESCDFMAALRSPSPKAQTTPVVIPDTDEIEPTFVESENDNKPRTSSRKPETITEMGTETPIRNEEESTSSKTVSSAMKSIGVSTPSNFQSPIMVPSSGLSGTMSPFQGDLLRAKREQNRGLVVSGLDAESRQHVSDFLKKFDFTFSQTFNDETSHVIVQTVSDDSLVCDRTLKYFLGIAGRCWVLSKQWLIDSIEQDFLEPEDSYEVKGDSVNGPEHNGPWRARNARTQLLTNFTICCHGEFSNLARSEIVRLIELCGGQAIVEEKDFLNSGSSKIRKLLLAEPHEDLRSSYFLALKKKYKMPVVSREWLLDSVAKYQVQKLKDYTLCTSSTNV